MESIFHEKQEGSLCAQHCLNALLQGNYFSAVELADIGRQLDETEKATMAEAGMDTVEYRHFLNQESTNFDDSGFFSIQVLEKALIVWDLELVPYSSSAELAQQARKDPRCQKAYICNFKEHWFCIRKLGQQWFNLNSLLKNPELVSDTYLHMYLLQLQQEGYAIFIVQGNLPDSEADQLLQYMKVEAAPTTYKPATNTEDLDPEIQVALMESKQLAESSESKVALQKALAQSREEAGVGEFIDGDDDEGDLARAIQLSLQAEAGTSGSVEPSTSAASSGASATPSPDKTPSAEELRKKRLAFLEKQGQNKDT